MPKLPLNRRSFRQTLQRYDSAVERKIRDLNAARGEPATRREVNAFFKRELARLGRFEHAIDLGCNTGDFARAVLAPRCRELILVDFSAKALARARATVTSPKGGNHPPSVTRGSWIVDREQSLRRRTTRHEPRTTKSLSSIPLAVSFLQADLTRDWAKIASVGPFDLVTLCEVIQHIPDAVKRRLVFARAARLVKRGGLFLFSHYARVPGEPAEGFFHSPHYRHLLYYHSAQAGQIERWANRDGLLILRHARLGPVNAFLMKKGPSGNNCCV